MACRSFVLLVKPQAQLITGPFLACRSFIPSVIEPSFGLGRILYCMFEHCFYTRQGDESRTVLRLPPVAAPFKASVFPLLQREDMNAAAQKLSSQLSRNVFNVIDTTGVLEADALGVQ